MKRNFVDYFEIDEDIKELSQNKGIEYDFMSYLRYIKNEYDVSFNEQARILNVTRQSIYKYSKIKTIDLPTKIIQKILEVTGTFSFDELMSSMKKIELETFYTKPFLESLVELNPYGGIRINGIGQLPDEYFDLFEFSDDIFHPVKLKSSVNYETMWRYYLTKNTFNSKMIDFIPNLGSSKGSAIAKKAGKVVSNHSKSYLKLLNVFIEKVEPNSIEFLSYVESYVKGKEK